MHIEENMDKWIRHISTSKFSQSAIKEVPLSFSNPIVNSHFRFAFFILDVQVADKLFVRGQLFCPDLNLDKLFFGRDIVKRSVHHRIPLGPKGTVQNNSTNEKQPNFRLLKRDTTTRRTLGPLLGWTILEVPHGFSREGDIVS